MPPTYSLVVPIFNEEAAIPILLKRLDALLESLDAPGEAIFVDDGSSDTSAIVIEGKARADQRYRLIKPAISATRPRSPRGSIMPRAMRSSSWTPICRTRRKSSTR
jgi:glycosyltransferase involved in cell wall biosynthesis